jgi:hypothetical protein
LQLVAIGCNQNAKHRGNGRKNAKKTQKQWRVLNGVQNSIFGPQIVKEQAPKAHQQSMVTLLGGNASAFLVVCDSFRQPWRECG